jgi:HAD superfamily hydrolase (TIGR01509 family)
MIDLVIFDCDGVLVDSEMLAVRVMTEQLGLFGVAVAPEEFLTGFVGLDERASHRRVQTEYGVTLPEDFNVTSARALEVAFRAELRTLPGVKALIERLDVPFCVGSNSSHPRLALTFETTGLAPLLAGRVFSADDVERGKPAPDLFLYAAKAMGVAPDRCLVIEDSVTGVTAARAAGMRVIGFCGASHIRDGHDQKLRALGVEAVVRSYQELAALLPLVAEDALQASA